MTREELLQTAKPIIFNTDMVRAILDGRKTVTRRIWKDWNRYAAPDMSMYDADKRTYAVHTFEDPEHTKKTSIIERRCPICPGDILYVRETWCDDRQFTHDSTPGRYFYKASENGDFKWKPSIHMPKEAARIFLKVTDVRVERLQEMNEDDAFAEGVSPWDDRCYAKNGWKPTFYDPDSGGACCPLDAFEDIWNSTIKKSDIDIYGWDANPWVWVIEFERIEV